MIPALQGYLAAVGEMLSADDPGALADAGAQMGAVAELVDGSTELTLAINDGSVPATARRAVLDDLLDGKVRPEVRSLADRAVTVVPASEVTAALHWLTRQLNGAADRLASSAADRLASSAADRLASSAESHIGSPPNEPDTEPVLGRLASRNRVNGYAAAIFEQVEVAEIEEIEDQLFRFARTVESNRALRTALGDRDLPVRVRQQVIAELLGDRALLSTRRLAAYAVRGGRARDIVSTLDALVVEAAAARGWRVARVQSSNELDDPQRQGISEALGRLTGRPVELQVTVDPALLGGVVVQVGDLLVDGSARHRLDQLKEHLLVSEAAYRVPEGRETADG